MREAEFSIRNEQALGQPGTAVPTLTIHSQIDMHFARFGKGPLSLGTFLIVVALTVQVVVIMLLSAVYKRRSDIAD